MSVNAMPTVTLPATETVPAETVPALGQGSWGWAERPARREDEINALRTGLDLGMTLIDTAEMYADGGAEELIGEALGNHRDDVFLVSKVYPHNATRQGTVEACKRSLRRLRTDRIDLYLLHWRGSTPLSETLEAFAQLQETGHIRHWGVSNFDITDMSELASVSGGTAVTTNQVLYNLTRRGIEYDLLPWCQQQGVPIMAYSPIEQGRVLAHPTLRQVANSHNASPARVALAWVLRQREVCVIPRASTPEHVRDNHAALELQLTSDDLAALDQAFPPPTRPQPLEIL